MPKSLLKARNILSKLFGGSLCSDALKSPHDCLYFMMVSLMTSRASE